MPPPAVKQPRKVPRKIRFEPESLEDSYKALPRDKLQIFGMALEAVSYDREPGIKVDNLSNGLIELKINGSPAWRVLYTLKGAGGDVVVVHVFSKTSEGPDHKNLKLARKRAKKA